MFKKLVLLSMIPLTSLTLTACGTDAQVASHNLSKSAEMFELDRRIIFYNGITGEYMLTIEGRCSINSSSQSKRLAVTCKSSPLEYKKHFLGLSDNVTYFSEQIGSAKVDVYQYRVVFKPETIIPNIDLETSISQ